MASKLMLHYGELFIKGKNRRDFIKQLELNLRHTLKHFKVHLVVKHDHMYLENFSEADKDAIISVLQNVSGLKLISEISALPRDLTAVSEAALTMLLANKGTTFKVVTKRKDKTFSVTSDAINRQIATHILKNSNWRVNVRTPDIYLKVEVLPTEILLITKQYEGLGGYPLGSAGKALLLLSGGIDSPVAGFLMLRRGIKLEAIHFASPPYTSDAVISKIKRLAGKLNVYQSEIVVHVVPFTPLQLAIYEHVPESYAITIMRRMMMRIAARLMQRRNARALVTGESLGQVASQTLESLSVINAVTNVPVIRPLATLDKVDIVAIAKKIDTYDISIEPYEDMCTIFPNRNPVTKPRVHLAEQYEAAFAWDELLESALADTVRVLVLEEDENLL